MSLEAPVDVDELVITVENVNGVIDVSEWSGDSVKIWLEIKARGDNDADAERNLDDFIYDLDDTTVGGTQDVSLTFPISSTKWNLYTVSMSISVPEGLETELVLDSTKGRIDVTGMVLQSVDVETTNGAINLDHVTSGSIYADTTNGVIDIELSALSGVHDFDTTNGIIDLKLPTGGDIGYSLDLDTSIGIIDVNLPDIDYSVDRTRNKIGETDGFSSKDIQITIKADTTIGAIDLN